MTSFPESNQLVPRRRVRRVFSHLIAKRSFQILLSALMLFLVALPPPSPPAQAQTLTDRQILEAFYDATDGPNWTTSTSWKTTAALNDWHGVTADGSDNVTELVLRQNNLTGPIPSSLSGLDSLTTLNLFGNDLTGSIPSSLGDLVSLTYLELGSNELTGEIPSELGDLSNLTELLLGTNQLTGEIPSELGDLGSLTNLVLAGNDLTGEIPTELGDLPAIQRLTLQDNQLTGEIPAWLNDLTTMTELRLWGNNLTGPIPDLSSLTAMQVLALGENDLTGEIPAWLGDLTDLRNLRLERNRLTGEIPSELGSIPLLNTLFLNTNELTGPIPPELASLSRMFHLRLNYNDLTGSIPSWMNNLTRLSQLHLNDNNFTGAIPDLSALTALQHLRLENNQLSGQIPDFSALTGLWSLYLSGNQLTGEIPSFGTGPFNFFEDLRLHDNQLTGTIPDLSALPRLRDLYLNGNRLTGAIPDLTSFNRMRNLYLHDNQLTGTAPNLHSNTLTGLQALSLGGNDLDLDWSTFGSSGPINLETARNLYYLYLHDSGLEGPIPDWIGARHTRLRGLWLQYNSLTGDIPENFNRLRILSDLRLHGNMLTGDFDRSNSLVTGTALILPVPADSGGGFSILTEGNSIYVGINSAALPPGSVLTSTRVTLDGSPFIAPGVIGSAPYTEVIDFDAVDIVLNFRNASGARVGSTLSEPITVCVATEAGSAGEGERLVLLRYDENEGWTALPSADPPAGYDPGAGNVAVCGMVSSFSIFVPAVVPPPPKRSAIARILRIEPSVRSATVSARDVVVLSFDIYGRQSILDNGLGDELVFQWDDGSAGGTFELADRDNRIVYTAPEIPGTYTVTADSPHDACLSGEDSEDRCIARFTIKVRRPSAATVERPAPKNPVGEVSSVLADAEGRQYEVFTPEEGGFFDGGDATISAEPGVVPNLEIVGLRISESGPASNEGRTHHRYTLAGHWYELAAVDGSGLQISSYELNDGLEVCVPLPAKLRSNIADLALVAVNADDSLTILSSRVRIAATGAKVCGRLSTVPTTLAVGTPGAPSPLPISDSGASARTGLPDTGAPTFSSVTVALWVALTGLTVLLIAFGKLRHSRRNRPTR